MANDNLGKIESAVLVTLPEDRIPDEAEVKQFVENFRKIFPISDAERDVLIRKLHARLAIRMDTGTAIVEVGHQPWLLNRKPDINPFFWDRYSKYLFKEGWSRSVVTTVDRVTDEILDLLGDPLRPGTWVRRGLVMGDVQSGKTATYTALCCKAADAGYRLIILLTGTLESLRRQTQERLDAGFVGLDSSGFLSQQRQRRAVGAGLIDQSRVAGVFTSRSADFSKDRMTQLNFRLNNFNEPILLVVKKNKRILQNLENWLRDYNATSDGRIDMSVLLIDDEADNASVNTRGGDQDPSAINERVRALLQLFYRSSYVGFTATPFANIFIDPESDHEMVGNDLFPRDFIYALEPPTNYVGPEKIFADDSSLNVLRTIEDADDIFPLNHKSSLQVTDLPPSLIDAVKSFVLANAIRDVRGEGATHRSMLINVSRFTDVQMQVAQLVDEKLRALQSDIRNYSKLSTPEALRNPQIHSLKEIYDKEFWDAGFSWEAVQAALVQAALPIVVKAVNQRTGAASLDYSSYREHGLRVIAVGGNSLSRGLTLEGLSTSYFFRNSQMYDTLLQMGRWFGYRDGYEDVCTLWLTEEAMHWYAHISLAVQELREEIKRMFRHQLTPKDFGLKVRAHPDSLIVTARNKMRTAQTIVREVSLSCAGIETARLFANPNTIRANSSALKDLLAALENAGIVREESPWESKNSLWRGVPAAIVSNFIRRFTSHPLNFSFQTEELAAFIEKTKEPKLQVWDIVLPNGEEDATKFAGVPFKPQRRKVTVSSGAILVSGSKARVGSRGVEREGIDRASVERAQEEYREAEGKKSMPDHKYRELRSRPLLLLHVVNPILEDEPLDTGGSRLVAVGLSFPIFDDREIASRAAYRVNLVEWRNLFDLEVDDDQDEGTENGFA